MSSPVQPAAGKAEWPSVDLEWEDYVLLGLIGTGGGAKVYRARHKRMDRIVAVKMLPPSAMRDADVVERFHREAKTAGKLIHPNIVTAFDAGDHQGIHYLVMEYVDGRPLTEIVEEQGPLPVDVALDYILQAARGLQYAHSLDVIHRDIKPSNLMVDSRGTVKILDMGLARVLGGSSAERSAAAAVQAGAAAPEADWAGAPRDGLTQVGQLLGTVGFMSPEQAKDGSLADQRTDIYALGCTLYYLLTGQLVFPGDLLQTVMAHAQKPVPQLRTIRQDVPELLESIFQRMMAKDPRDRYQSMEGVIQDLQQCARVPVQRPTFASRVPMPWQVKTALLETVNLVSSKTDTRKATLAAVGIDLGTTSSAIAYVDEGGRPAVICNRDGRSMTPSAVLLRGKELAIGQRAASELPVDPDHVIDQPKRLLGQTSMSRMLDGQEYSPEVFTALILKRLASDARQKLGHFEDVVLAVPASFDENRRRAAQHAGYMAGLNVLDLVNEPTAAAVALAHQQGYLGPQGNLIVPQNVVVVDLGSGTFDVSVLTIEGATICACPAAATTNWAEASGTNDWWISWVSHWRPSWAWTCGLSRAMRRNCGSSARRSNASCPTGANQPSWSIGRARPRATIPRSYFDELTADLLDSVRRTVHETVRAAGLDTAQIHRLLLAGGATPHAVGARRPGRVVGTRYQSVSIA